MALADVLTITASITSFAIATPVATSVMYVRVLRLMRIIRVLRALRLFRGAGGEAMLVGGLRHIVLNICSTILVIWLVSACLLQYVEWVGQDDEQLFKQMMPWHQASYYMLIEVLGRPRIPVESTGAYAVLTVVVLLVFFFVPQQLAALLEAIRRDSTFRRSYYAPSKTAEHVVVAGHINFSSLHDFLVDFFHEDHHTHRTHVVVLCDEEPPVEVRVLLSHPQLSQWVVYLQGSLERAADLERARLDIALGVFLFADKELLSTCYCLLRISDRLPVIRYSVHLPLPPRRLGARHG